MFHVKAGVAVIAAIAFGGVPAVASATTSPLTGESLSVTESSTTGQTPFGLPCAGASNGPGHFFFSGNATGPYSGRFSAFGTVSYDASRCGPPSVTTPLTKYTAHFRILSGRAVIAGTETMTGTAQATSNGSAGGSWVGIGPVSTSYRATITKPHKVCTDRGTSTASLSVAFGVAWYASLTDGPFSSTQGLSCRP